MTKKQIIKELQTYLEATKKCIEENEKSGINNNDYLAGYSSALQLFIDKLTGEAFFYSDK